MTEQNSETLPQNPEAEPISRLEIVGKLRAQLTDVMPDAETLWQQSGPSNVQFRGHLAIDPTSAYSMLRERFATLGYTPLLRNQSGYDVIVAIRHLFRAQRTRPIGNIILFLLTLVTTTLTGAVLEQGEVLQQNPMIFFERPLLLLTGIPAALTIMGILGIHELAHYFVARRHGLQSSLPYFIPSPFGVGTFGAIIRIQTPWENSKALFDVGMAGPVAGFLVALPLFFVGLLISPAMPPIPEGVPLGSPLLLRWIEELVYLIRGIPQDHEIYVNAMTFAAWFGLVVTGFNLLPVGQLDGGHVAYAVLGRWARLVGIAVLVLLALLGALVWQGWYVWAGLIFFSGWRHPAPLNTLAPLGKTRTLVGVAILVLLILLFTPAPFPI
jgi:membrane-associated protease RseP (regulator of RpoE activity)